jgi:hypothetical protein
MDRSFVQRNAETRERLRTLLTGIEPTRKMVEDGWTISALLAHLAFWDRMVEARWDQYDREGTIAQLPDGLVDLINAANLPLWLATPPRRSVELVLITADEVDQRIEALPDAAVEYALASGRLVLVDRSPHRQEHLAQIERLLAGRTEPAS